MPRDGVRQAHACQQPVDHEQVCERAGVQGPRWALLGDEARVALGQAGRPLAQALNFPEEISQPTQQPVGEGTEATLHPSSPSAKGFMRERPLLRRQPSSREAIMGTCRACYRYRWRKAVGSGSGSTAYLRVISR